MSSYLCIIIDQCIDASELANPAHNKNNVMKPLSREMQPFPPDTFPQYYITSPKWISLLCDKCTVV